MVVVDATGIGGPVVDLLKRGQLGCAVVPVTITSGDAATGDGTMHRVPKRDLMAGLQVLFEDQRFSMATGMCDGSRLMEELRGMRSSVTASGRGRYEGSKNDLVLALALAWWWARRGARGIWGTKRLL